MSRIMRPKETSTIAVVIGSIVTNGDNLKNINVKPAGTSGIKEDT